jgi:hypothetical protein
MKCQTRIVTDKGVTYAALAFICPGCKELTKGSGMHILPVNTNKVLPSWEWNGSITAPTLGPSVLTRTHMGVCHSFITDGVFMFLEDCEHSLAGQLVPMEDLPAWAVKEQ